MATIKSYTDIEQSRKLAKILPIESADMYYFDDNGGEPNFKVRNGITYYYDSDDCLPCWSLASLLGVLPEGIIENYYAPNLQKENGKYSIAYGDDELLCIADNPIDACVAMVDKLNKLNLL